MYYFQIDFDLNELEKKVKDLTVEFNKKHKTKEIKCKKHY
jgi:hypothetical protein